MCSVSLWLSHASLTDLITSEWSGNIMFRPASFSLSLLLSLSPHPSLSFSLCLCLSFCLFLSLALIGISISLTGTNYGPNNGPPMPTEVIYDDHTTWSNIFADYYAACFSLSFCHRLMYAATTVLTTQCKLLKIWACQCIIDSDSFSNVQTDVGINGEKPNFANTPYSPGTAHIRNAHGLHHVIYQF